MNGGKSLIFEGRDAILWNSDHFEVVFKKDPLMFFEVNKAHNYFNLEIELIWNETFEAVNVLNSKSYATRSFLFPFPLDKKMI